MKTFIIILLVASYVKAITPEEAFNKGTREAYLEFIGLKKEEVKAQDETIKRLKVMLRVKDLKQLTKEDIERYQEENSEN